MKIKCDIYKSAKKPDTYLYLVADKQPQDLPEPLKVLLGDLTRFLNLELSESSKLAQVDARDVLAAIMDQEYFLQMPPGDHRKEQLPGSGYIQ